MNKFFIKINYFNFYVLEWSVFGVMSMPDKDKVEECDKCTRLAIHTFTKGDHEAFSLD